MAIPVFGIVPYQENKMERIAENEIASLWNMVFNLALNFLHDENDAEEAAQEVFIKANGSIAGFRHEAALSTWVYRIAYNYLIDQKRLRFRDEISFELFGRDVTDFTPYGGELGLSEAETAIYVEQVKIGCTKAMLQCLDPVDRFVFILGKIFGFGGNEGATVCEMSEEGYRQRLSRASKKITNFMTLNCGLINDGATCHCKKRIGIALERHRIDPDMLLHHTDSRKIKDYLKGLNELDSVAEAFRDNPFIDKSALCTDELRRSIERMANAVI